MVGGLLDPRVDAPINMIQPVNLLHPLMLALAGWWAGLPGTTGGARFMDIMNPGPNGNHLTLVNVDPATAWVPSSQPGGWRALKFDGSNDYGETQSPSVPPYPNSPNDPISWFATITPIDFTGDSMLWSRGQSDDFNFASSLGLEDSTGNLYVADNLSSDGEATISSLSPPLNQPSAIGATSSPAETSFFLNGAYETGAARVSHTISTNNPVTIGAAYRNKSVGFFTTVRIDSIIFWSRVLSEQEFQQLYLLSLQGYPGLLNRIRAPRFGVAAVAGGLQATTQAIIIS